MSGEYDIMCTGPGLPSAFQDSQPAGDISQSKRSGHINVMSELLSAAQPGNGKGEHRRGFKVRVIKADAPPHPARHPLAYLS